MSKLRGICFGCKGEDMRLSMKKCTECGDLFCSECTENTGSWDCQERELWACEPCTEDLNSQASWEIDT